MTKRISGFAFVLACILCVAPQYLLADKVGYTASFQLHHASSSGPCANHVCEFDSPYVAGANGLTALRISFIDNGHHWGAPAGPEKALKDFESDENEGNGHTDGILPGFSTLTDGDPPNTPTTSSPEPASLALLGFGLVGLTALLRSRANRQ